MVELLEAPLDVQAGAEDQGGGGRAERDPRDRPDPAPVHGEHEEEDDPEQHHRAAGPGERLRTEEHRPVDFPRRASRLRAKRGHGAQRRRRLWRLSDGRRWRHDRRRRDRGRRGGRASKPSELGELVLEHLEPPCKVVEPGAEIERHPRPPRYRILAINSKDAMKVKGLLPVTLSTVVRTLVVRIGAVPGPP